MAALLRRELSVAVGVEPGPYGSFEVWVRGTRVVQGGRLVFLGVLPGLAEIREQVERALHTPAS